MDKNKAIRYITDNISNEKKKSEVRNWINENEENKQFFAGLKNIYALTRKGNGSTDVVGEYLKLQSGIYNRSRRLFTEFMKYAAVIILAVGLTWIVKENYFDSSQSGMMQMNEVICPAGQIAELVLADGTKVWLNAESKISYPSNFDNKHRSVQLEGEAFFDVTKNKKSPFVVKTNTINVRVLGTSFNVEAYDKSQFRTTLIEGKVELQNKKGDKITEMSPGQLAKYDFNKKTILLSEVDTRFYSSWKEGKMTFFNEPLELIATKLERWYNVKFTFANEDIKTYRFSSTILKTKPLDQVLQVLKLSSSIDYKVMVKPDDRNEIILTKQK